MYGDEIYGDYYGEEDNDIYGLEDNKYIQKALGKKSGSKKVTNRSLSSHITAQVKRKC